MAYDVTEISYKVTIKYNELLKWQLLFISGSKTSEVKISYGK